jgi:hypothetical protein
MHYSTVGSIANGPGQIGDAKNDDGLPAYEPERTHALVTENEALCEINADSYAWMSVDMVRKEGVKSLLMSEALLTIVIITFSS